MATTPTEKISMFIYFESLFVGVLDLYVLNMHIKFHVNQTLFTNLKIIYYSVFSFNFQFQQK